MALPTVRPLPSALPALAPVAALVCLLAGPAGCGGDGRVAGSYDHEAGLELRGEAGSLRVPPGALAEPKELWMRVARPENLAEAAGPQRAVELGPDGTRFQEPVRVSVELARPTPLGHLPLLARDAQTGLWVPTDQLATVGEEGRSASFETRHFSSWLPWSPSLPESDGPPSLGGGSGSFSTTSLSPPTEVSKSVELAGDATFLYSPVGNLLTLTLKSLALSAEAGPQGAEAGTSTFVAALNASRVEEVGDWIVGYALPGGGMGGPTYVNTGTTNSPAVGLVLLGTRDGRPHIEVFAASRAGPFHAEVTTGGG